MHRDDADVREQLFAHHSKEADVKKTKTRKGTHRAGGAVVKRILRSLSRKDVHVRIAHKA